MPGVSESKGSGMGRLGRGLPLSSVTWADVDQDMMEVCGRVCGEGVKAREGTTEARRTSGWYFMVRSSSG